MRPGYPLLISVLALCGAAVVATQTVRVQLGEQPDGTFLVPSNQTLSPVGTLRRIEGARPKDAALSPDGGTLAVLTTTRVELFTSEGTPVASVPARPGPLGIAWAPDGGTLYVSSIGGKVSRLRRVDGQWRAAGELAVEAAGAPRPGGRQADPQVAGLAVSPDGKRLYAALGIRNAVAVVDVESGQVTGSVPVGVCPYHVTLSRDGKQLFVANRGGELVEGDAAETADSAGTRVRIDPRTDAALRGSLSIVDTASLRATQIPAGRQPSGMAASLDGRTLYVANSDGDSISVVDVRRARVAATVSVRPGDDPGFGQIPTDVALSNDGRQLYVTCGGGNALAVLTVDDRPRVRGYLPAGWYPVAVEERDGRLYVASAKGIGARLANAQGKYRVHSSIGTVQFITPEQHRDVAALSRQVARNNRWGEEREARSRRAPVPVPERVGEPSVFKHVVYIIKENHTYDITLGDMKEGNGDPSLTVFGEEVTPNQHALARQWVLLDNTYTSGTNSADGHQWTDSAAGNGYIEQNYAAHARSYPYDGGDPLSYSPEGFLWTTAVQKGLSVRVYGEFVNQPKIEDTEGKIARPRWSDLWQDYKAGGRRFRITADTDNGALKPLLHPNFIGFPSTVSDQWRADQYLADLKEFERSGKMPQLSIMLLPNDHTAGTQPGMPTPRAAVADNDLAVGRIIDAVSHSRFWKETLILVIQDDSQLGLDHVDGHRTLAYCVSPYTRRGVVVSDPFNHTSFTRTIGLVLGLPALSRFDRTATPLTSLFTSTPDFRPFTHLRSRIPLDELNPPARALRGEAKRLALASDSLDWSDVDRADAEVVARAVWHSRKPGVPFPERHFHPVEDEDEEEEAE